MIGHNYSWARPYSLADIPFALINSLLMFIEIQSLIAMLVTMGLTPLALGNTLVSLMYNPSVPQTLPLESTTPSRSWTDMRFVPI